MDYSSSQKRITYNSSSSAESIGHNEYLITQISIHLPIKSILRFQSVSKQWSSLLTHPIFITSRKSKNSILFLEKTKFSPGSIPGYLSLKENIKNVGIDNFNNYMQNPTQDSLKVESSCNGLLLLSSKGFQGKEQSQRRRFYVCNPFTKKHVELMVDDTIAEASSSCSAHLAFDPRTSLSYKVIFFWIDNECSKTLCTCVYSSETKSYSETKQTKVGDYIIRFLFESGIYFDGSIFLKTLQVSRFFPSIYYFDINQESLYRLPNPSNFGTEATVMYFGEFRGHLNMILYYFDPEPGVIEMFELKEDYSGWVVKYKVDIESIAVGFPEIMQINCSCQRHYFDYSIKWFKCVLEEEEHEPSLVLCVRNLLLAYNPVNKTTRKLCDLPFCDNLAVEDGSELASVYHCKESLFPV